MEKNMNWTSSDPLSSVDRSDSDHQVKLEVKCEPGFENQACDGTDVKAENPEAEEVQVKVEREDETSAMQCSCMSAPGGCAACALKSGRSEGNSESGCDGLEGEMYKKRSEGIWYLLPYILTRRDPETGLIGLGFLGLAQGEQNMEGASGGQQEQAVDSPSSNWLYKWCPVNVQGSVCGSVNGREEEESRAEGRETVMQPLISMETCKVEVQPVSGEGTGVDRLCGGGEQEVEEGVLVHPRTVPSVPTGVAWSGHAPQWSDSSSAPVGSSSSCSPNSSEPTPHVFNVATAQLSFLEQHRKQEGLQSCSSVAHQGLSEASALHPNVRAVPEGLKRHACSQCDYRCEKESRLQRHVEAAHEALRQYSCPHCQYRAQEKRNLQKHIEAVHEGVRNYPCSYCEYKAKYKCNLQEHIKTIHEGVREYSCTQCEYKAARKLCLQTHIETVHKGMNNYPCPHCQYRANYKYHLKRHIETIHEGSKKFPCPHCEYRSAYNHCLQMHIETVHEGIWKYLCPYCGYRTGKKGDLQTHIDAVHEGLRRHQCPHCQYKSDHRSTLQRHVRAVHEGLRKYQCPRCQYKAGRNSTLQEHIETVHEGIRKYPCSYCHFRAAHKSDLQKHVDNVHEGLKKHHCPHCQHKAGRKSALRKHIRSVHHDLVNQECPSTGLVGEAHSEDA